VSKASDDLPEPDNPVITTSLLRGTSTLMFFRLFTRAPLMEMYLLSAIPTFSELSCKDTDFLFWEYLVTKILFIENEERSGCFVSYIRIRLAQFL
jgi:hypothetical protein